MPARNSFILFLWLKAIVSGDIITHNEFQLKAANKYGKAQMGSYKENRTVLVTGASSGMGKAFAELLAVNGYRVFGTSRRANFSEINGVTMVPMDVNECESVRAAVDYVHREAGAIDVLVNNAGYGVSGAVEDTTVEEAKVLFETNFFGVHRVCSAVIPTMREQGQGHIVNIGSIGGVVSIPFQAFYSASKSALASLSDGMSMELKPYGIRVTRIEPGDYKTGFTANREMVGRSDGGSVYKDHCDSAVAVMEYDEQNGADPEKLAIRLLVILRMSNPKLVYREGMFMQTTLVKLLPLLPRSWTEKLIMKIYNI
jgi:short-subunit dehydrogenase